MKLGQTAVNLIGDNAMDRMKMNSLINLALMKAPSGKSRLSTSVSPLVNGGSCEF